MRSESTSLFKMICLDIDGTLLTHDHQIQPAVRKEVGRVAAMGLPIILVTARMPASARIFRSELGLSTPMICYGGALIEDEDGSFILNRSFSPKAARIVWRMAAGKGLTVNIYRDDEWWIERDDEWTREERAASRVLPGLADFDALLADWEREGRGPNKILCLGYPEQAGKLRRRLDEDSGRELAVLPSKPTHLEVIPGNASKTIAIDLLRQRFDVNRAEIMAVGDNYNDIDMLLYAGLGVAMGNAPDEVKQHADDVTASNDEGGVALALRKYLSHGKVREAGNPVAGPR